MHQVHMKLDDTGIIEKKKNVVFLAVFYVAVVEAFLLGCSSQ